MKRRHPIPNELLKFAGKDPLQFMVWSGKVLTYKKVVMTFFIVLFLTAVYAAFIYNNIMPLINGETIRIGVNKQYVNVSPDNWTPVLTPLIVFSLFYLASIFVLFYSVILLTKRKGFYAGTDKNLIHYYKGTFETWSWNQFEPHINIKGNNKKGNLILYLSKNNSSHYSNRQLHIIGIKNAQEIKEKCIKIIEMSKN